MGGMVKAIEAGYPQKEIAEASYAYQRAVEAGEKIIVGVNQHAMAEPPPAILYIGERRPRGANRKAQEAARRALRRGRRSALWMR